jgi:hypothetical protein
MMRLSMISMGVVALHLQIEAIKSDKPLEERDLFGRSAYNRYYYASFLHVRKMLTELDIRWSRTPHNDYPNILRITIRNEIRKYKKTARKSDDLYLLQLYSQAINAAHELAVIMEKSYATRVVADYHPDIQVDFTNSNRFKLQRVEITEAHQWPEKAKVLAETITSAWKQAHAQ